MFAEKTQAMVIERDKTGRSLEIAGTWKQWQECGNNFEVIFIDFGIDIFDLIVQVRKLILGFL